MNVDDYQVKMVRPCTNCKAPRGTHHCPACGGTGRAEVSVSFSRMVKHVLTDVFARPEIERLNDDIKTLTDARDTLRAEVDRLEKKANG